MGGTQGWLCTLWSLSVIDKDGEDVRKLRKQRLGDRVIKRVNKCIANAFLGFLAQCAMQVSHVVKDREQSSSVPQSIYKECLNHNLGLTLLTPGLVHILKLLHIL